MIKLGKLRIENFKSFKDKPYYDFDFSNKNLVLFDGPNGFGKTTIFDAIEICLIGKISRIFPTDSKIKETHLLKGETNKITRIFLELKKNNETLIIICVYIPAINSSSENKVDKINDTINRYQLNNWNEIDNFKPNILSQLNGGLNELFDNEKLDSTFSIFNYIQQEETNNFLKFNEVKRHKQINHLFGTQKESDQQDKVREIYEKLNERIKNDEKKLIELQKNISVIEEPESSSILQSEIKSSNKIESLKEIEIKSFDQLKSYSNHLKIIEWALLNQETYSKFEFNRLLNKLIEERKEEIKTLLKLGVVKNYSRIDSLKRLKIKWERINSNLTKYKKLINNKPKKPGFDSIKYLENVTELFPEISSNYKNQIDTFIAKSNQLESYEKILFSIQENRESLLKHYGSHTHSDPNEETNCPFCGTVKDNWRQLLSEYNSQSERFKLLLGEEVRDYKVLWLLLLEKVVEPIILIMGNYVKKYSEFNSVKVSRFFEYKIVNINDFNRMVRVRSWLDLNSIDYNNFIDEKLFDSKSTYNLETLGFLDFLKSKFKTINPDIDVSYEDVRTSLIALNIGSNSIHELSFDLDDIQNDLNYINHLILNVNSESHQEQIKAITKLSNDIGKLKEKLSSVRSIGIIYKNQIKQYESKVAKQVSIPLYVYSSKILQSRLEGSGIF